MSRYSNLNWLNRRTNWKKKGNISQLSINKTKNQILVVWGGGNAFYHWLRGPVHCKGNLVHIWTSEGVHWRFQSQSWHVHSRTPKTWSICFCNNKQTFLVELNLIESIDRNSHAPDWATKKPNVQEGTKLIQFLWLHLRKDNGGNTLFRVELRVGASKDRRTLSFRMMQLL